jgi:PadR family transcriptional regulator PadR
MTHNAFKGHLKFLVLKSLENHPMSGYSMMKFIEQKLGERPSPGSMYPLCKEFRENNLTVIRKVGRSNEFSLTGKGKEELKKMQELKGEIFKDIANALKKWMMVSGEDAEFFTYLMESMHKGEIPFKELNPELARFRDNLVRIGLKERTAQKTAKLKALLKKFNQEASSI